MRLLAMLARSLGVVLVVGFATFVLMYGNADGIAHSVLGLRASDEDVARKVAELGLDRPLAVQFLDWFRGVLAGDFGRSFFTGESVAAALASRVPVTLTIVALTLVLTALVSVALGTAAAVRGGWLDRAVQVLAILGAAVPSFVVAIVLVFALAVRWRIFPATGYAPLADGAGPWALSVALPVLALALGTIAGVASQIRNAVLDVLDKDYVRTLRARGIPERAVLLRHVLRNAAAPALTALSLTAIALFGGAVFIEQVFALPGMGQLANSAAQISDVPMVMGTVLVTILLVLAINFLSDIGVMLLSPKARAR